MIELNGKYDNAIIYSDEVEDSAVSQVYGMPDVHTGKGSVIGYTAYLGDKVAPNIVRYIICN